MPLPNPSVVNFHHFPTKRVDESVFFGSHEMVAAKNFSMDHFSAMQEALVLEGMAAGKGISSSSAKWNDPRPLPCFCALRAGKGRRQADRECPDGVSAQHARGKEQI